MGWDEWEQLKAGSAGRHSAGTQLNQVPGEPGSGANDAGGGGGAGRLRHSSHPWSRAATTAEDLHRSTSIAKTELHDAHAGPASGIEGLASLGALRSVLSSWEERLGSVTDECASLESELRRVSRDMGEVDVRVGAKADGAHVPDSRKGE
jgi:hypothetical protein